MDPVHRGGPRTRSIEGSMDPVKTRDPCFVLSRPPLIFLQIHMTHPYLELEIIMTPLPPFYLLASYRLIQN